MDFDLQSAQLTRRWRERGEQDPRAVLVCCRLVRVTLRAQCGRHFPQPGSEELDLIREHLKCQILDDSAEGKL